MYNIAGGRDEEENATPLLGVKCVVVVGTASDHVVLVS